VNQHSGKNSIHLGTLFGAEGLRPVRLAFTQKRAEKIKKKKKRFKNQAVNVGSCPVSPLTALRERDWVRGFFCSRRPSPRPLFPQSPGEGRKTKEGLPQLGGAIVPPSRKYGRNN